MPDDRIRPIGRPGQPMPRNAELIHRYLSRSGSKLIEDIVEHTGLSHGDVVAGLRWLTNHGMAELIGYEYRAL